MHSKSFCLNDSGIELWMSIEQSIIQFRQKDWYTSSYVLTLLEHSLNVQTQKIVSNLRTLTKNRFIFLGFRKKSVVLRVSINCLQIQLPCTTNPLFKN